MRPVSATFLDTVRGSHKAVFRARICAPGQSSINPTGTEISILDGDVTFDTNSDVNGSLDLTTQIDWPAKAASLGSPYGSEIFVERGVQYGTGTREWVGLGYFRINSVEQVRAPKSEIRISGEDRMAMVRDARPTAPQQFTAGTSVGAVMDFVVGDAVPGVVTVYDWDAYSALLTSDHILDDDRVKFLQEIVTAYGKVMYFDYRGRFVVKTAPTGTTTPVFQVDVGHLGVLCAMKRTISRDGVYNGVVATGEPVGEAPPVRGQALDLVTTSPTYWFGNFGKVPKFFSSSFLQTVDQCTSAAASILASSTGLPYVVNLGVVPNPALEGWDVVKVVYDPYDSVGEKHILDTITYGLSAESTMNLATRKQFLV